jgi:VWFA-related protein
MRKPHKLPLAFAMLLSLFAFGQTETVSGQGATMASADGSRNPGKPVTIPLSVRVKGERTEAEFQTIDLTVSEDGDPQTVLSIRAMVTNSPITLAVLIQDDLVPSIGIETKPTGAFVRSLAKGSRVMVGYIRTGSLQIRQRFTTDLEKAAKAVRPPNGLASAAPYNPYVEVIEAIKRFEGQPAGRRAILLLSDGLDTSRGIESSSPTESLDLQRAINAAQRHGIAVYTFYAPTVSGGSLPLLVGNAQSSLLRLASETGGKAYFQGTGAPVSLEPFIKDLGEALERQIAVTFLSTHPGKGFHKIAVKSSTPGVEVVHPSGYYR